MDISRFFDLNFEMQFSYIFGVTLKEIANEPWTNCFFSDNGLSAAVRISEMC